MLRKHNTRSLAIGAILFIAASQFFLFLFVSTALYPNYNVNFNYISDLGETCRHSVCYFQQPSSIIFNSSSFVLGALVVISFSLLLKEKRKSLLPYFGIVSGLGAAGVGLFPEGTGMIHAIFALMAFLSGGIAAAVAYRELIFPFNVLSIILGLVSLTFLGLFLSLTAGNLTSASGKTILGLGVGGLERLIVYPIILWISGIGAYIMRDGSSIMK
jgi:hypothetical membrane protein